MVTAFSRPPFWLTAQGFALLVLLVTAVRVLWLLVSPFTLFMDEAQYWGWAKELDWGYYSKPPMVAWAIALTTGIFGDAEWAIKLASPFAHAITTLLVCRIGRQLWNEETGYYAGLLYLSLPAVTFSATIISTDPFLLLYWALALTAFLEAMENNRWRAWLLCGFACGLGLLSKYNFALFAVSALWVAAQRGKLLAMVRNPRAWAGLAMALLTYAPNFLWNVQNGFVSYLHTEDNAKLEGPLIHPLQMLEFLGAQFGVFGPIPAAILFLMLFRIRHYWRGARGRYAVLLAFILPMLGLITTISLLSRAHANWAAPAYIGASVLVAGWAMETGRKRLLHWALVSHLAIAGVFYVAKPVLETTYPLLLARGNESLPDPFRRVKGWDALGQEVSRLLAERPGTVLLMDDRTVMAQMRYYVRPHPFNAVRWNADGAIKDHYDLTADIAKSKREVREGAFLYLTRYPQPLDVLARFRKSEALKPVTLTINPARSETYYVFALEGFTGYH
jgi:4-amino-4-deoxy-L-arabinose transferase-like glycosyltransferase